MTKPRLKVIKCNSLDMAIAIPAKDPLLHKRKPKFRSSKTRNMGCCSLKCGGIASVVIGVILILAGSIGGFVGFPILFKDEVRRQAVLIEGTDTWTAWKDPPLPVYMNFTFFHVKNPDEVAEGGKPSVEEVGPFVYQEKRTKFISDPRTVDETVIYTENKTWFFDAEKSFPLTDNVNITIINPVLATLGKFLGDYLDGLEDPMQAKEILSLYDQALKDLGVSATMTNTPAEILFDGFPLDPYLEAIGTACSASDLVPEFQCRILANLIADILDSSNLVFGFFSAKNGTDEGAFEIDNGKRNADNLGLIRKWKNETQLNFWPDLDGKDSCDKINGTDGTMFGPLTTGTDKNKRLYLFVSDLCRSLYMTYNKDVEHFGITTRRYTVPPSALASPADNPENVCYCHSSNLEECPGSVLPLYSCQYGAPVFMSTPHFYMTNTEELITDFEGIKPVKELHETFLDLDPIISVPISARKRIQINMKVKKTYPLPSFENLQKDYIFPIMWVDEGADFDQATADLIKAEVYTAITALDALRWVLIGLGIGGVVLSVFMLIKAKKKSKQVV